ncbi:MAG: response regulator [Chloroflexi bacterium]|uniref:response regulator n=1 Tax=Candidatus Flexifilum breve TaxID=3140694 RepID=UPI0031351B3B|nr:response regulator [Chloroflexota bacterium]
MSAHILVVDDSVVARRIIVQILEAAGYEVTGVTSGAEAPAVFEAEPVDLAIFDIAMPDIDGFTLLRRVRECPTYKHIPVIMLTASGRDEDVRTAREMGANSFLTKPSSSQMIMQTVAGLLAD